MNRRDFMKAALLVPLALATKVQETRSAEDVLLEIVNQPGWTLGDQVFHFSPSETFAEIGRNVAQGYVEGIQKGSWSVQSTPLQSRYYNLWGKSILEPKFERDDLAEIEMLRQRYALT